jgi:hypothetical protein
MRESVWNAQYPREAPETLKERDHLVNDNCEQVAPDRQQVPNNHMCHGNMAMRLHKMEFAVRGIIARRTEFSDEKSGRFCGMNKCGMRS